MSAIPLYTGGGTDDPNTVSQFRQARTFTSGGGGITEITSDTSTLQVTNPNGPTVTLQYNGIDTVAGGVGINVTPSGNTATIDNTGVTQITTNTPTYLNITSPGNTGTGVVNLDVVNIPSGGGGTAPVQLVEAFSIVMKHNSAALQPSGLIGAAAFSPFVKQPAQDALWTTIPPPDFSAFIGGSQGFTTLTSGSLELTDSGTFTVGIAGLYIFAHSSFCVATGGVTFPLGLIKNVLSSAEMIYGVEAGNSAYTSTKLLYLQAGDTVTLGYWNADADGSKNAIHNANAPNLADPGTSSYTRAPIVFSGALISTPVASTESASEKFAVTLDTDSVVGTGNSAWAAVGAVTHILDTGTFPNYDPNALFNELSIGGLNLATGTFTVGVTGHYIMALTSGTVTGSSQNTTIGLRVNGSKILRGIFNPGNAPNIPFVSFQFFTAGDTVQLVAWDNAGTISRATVDGVSGVNIPQIIWSGYLVRGSGSGGATAPAETIAVMVANDRTVATTSNVPFDIVDWTDTLDTVQFPEITPKCLYNNLTASTFNLTTGTFTAGTTGMYRVELDTNQWSTTNSVGGSFLRYKINGTELYGPETQYGPSHVFSLTAGDTISLIGVPTTSGSGNYPRTYILTSGSHSPVFIWSIQAITDVGTGGGGGTGTDEAFQVAQSADISLTSTNTWVTIAPVTDTVNTGTFPDVSTESLFVNLTTGLFNTTTGIFTVGVTGDYYINWTIRNTDNGNYTLLPCIDDTKFVLNSTTVDRGNASCLVHLTAGQTVRLKVFDALTQTLPYVYSDAGIGVDYYAQTWGAALVKSGSGGGGGGGGGGSTDVESFSVALSTPYSFSTAGAWEAVSVWTDTLDTGTFTDYDTKTLFQHLTSGSLNLTTGQFTVGVTGRYLLTMTVRIVGTPASRTMFGFERAGLVTRGAQNSGGYDTWTILLDLTAGDIVRPVAWSIGGGTIPISIPDYTSSNPIPAVIWGCYLLSTGSGGGGGGTGVVETIVAGAAIGVDSTDPANPIVTNNGVRSVSSSHAYLTVNNTDPRNPVLSNNGVLTLATTGGASGLAITGTANNPILRNTGIRSITSGTPATLSVVNNSGAVTLSVTGGGGGGGGSGTVVGVTAAAASGAEVPNVGLTITNPTSNVQIQNNAVLRVSSGSGINISGDQRNRTISVGQLGSGSNYTVFDPVTGFQTMSGSARPWKTETIPMIYVSTSDATQAPGSNEIYAGARSWFPAFRNAANINSLTGFWAVPYELAWTNIGVGQYATTTYFGINWMPNTTATGNVRWRLRWKYLRGGDVLAAGTPFVTDGVTQSAGGVVGSLRWTGFFAVNQVVSGLPNTGQGDIIAVSVQRDPDDPLDTYPDQALFCGLRVVYPTDQLGGRQNTAR